MQLMLLLHAVVHHSLVYGATPTCLHTYLQYMQLMLLLHAYTHTLVHGATPTCLHTYLQYMQLMLLLAESLCRPSRCLMALVHAHSISARVPLFGWTSN